MYSKMINKIFLVVLVTMGSFLIGYSNYPKTIAEKDERGLFSWENSEIVNKDTEIFKVMKKFQLNTLYQAFSKELHKEDGIAFLERASSENVGVYLLAGDPEWALQKDGKSACFSVEEALELNNWVKEDQGFKGIIFDVEPYLSTMWCKQNYQEIMDCFVKGMKVAYKKAHSSGLEMIICVPYYYDNIRLSGHLKDLIRFCSDGIAVMNYYQGKEYKHIKLESELTNRYKKSLINIYELQAPGKHGLTDKNTYYGEGIEAVEINFEELKKKLNIQDISIALHEYDALREVAEFE